MADESETCFWRSVPIVVKNHGHELMTCLHKQQQSGHLCDVWLVIENEKFSAHKAVLASFSSYFQTLFESGLQTDTARSKACSVKEIHLSSVKKSTFLPILHFIYTSRLHVFKENIADILRTSRKLQIASIVEICDKLIEDRVVLPSLNEAQPSSPDVETEAETRAKSNILYVDLSNGDEEEETGKKNDGIQEKNNEAESSRKAAKSFLGFENLPDTHSNGWPMRPSEPAVRIASTSGLSAEAVAGQSQADSAYCVSTTGQAGSTTSIITYSTSPLGAGQSPHQNGTKDGPVSRKSTVQLECTYCGKFFSKKTNLKRHILIKHSMNHRFNCPRCDKRYAIEQSLRYHMATVHGIVNVVTSATGSTSASGLVTQASQSTSAAQQSLLSSLISSSGLDNRMSSSFVDTSANSSFLAQSIAASSVEDVILNLPHTTLFPSIGNLGEPAGLDKADVSTCSDSDNSLYKLCREQYQVSQSSSSREANANSDDDMPTISRVESIREPFLDGENNAFDESTISIDSSIREVMDVTSDVLIKTDPDDREKEDMVVLEPVNAVSSSGTNQVDVSRADSTTIDQVILPMDNTSTSEATSALLESNQALPRALNKDPVKERPRLNLQNAGTASTQSILESPLTGIFNMASSSSAARLQYLQPRNIAPALISTQAVQSAAVNALNLVTLPVCGTCGKLFPSNDQLVIHKRKCSKCPFCHRIFSQYSNMKRHIDIFHSAQKPHKCYVCGRAYGIKQSMKLHMQTKHGIPFVTRKYNRQMKGGPS